MADVILKVKVLLGFKDSATKEPCAVGDVLDMTPDRYAQAVASLARWPGKFLEVVGTADGAEETPVQEAPAATPAEPEAGPEAPKSRGKKRE